MADERIDIEIVDKVSPNVKVKLDGIAASARSANSALEQLKASIAQVNANPLNKLAQAEAKSATAATKLADANAKAALTQQRLATEAQRTAATQSRAETASLRLAQAQKRASESAKGSGFSFSAMKGQILGVVAALGSLWAAMKLADDFANLENRLRSTGLEGDGLNTVMQKLQDSANNTRSSLAGTVELYSRLAVSSKELGVSQNELIQFTTSLNQAILLSGANAAEAQAGLIQLSQGMASGTLRGDELRSVLEQLPAVADVIAKSLGVTRGQLRQLGADGKITAQTILQAFREAGPELGERFAGQATTASQALEVMKNKMLELAGEEGKGSLEQVTGMIVDLTKALDDLRANGSLGLIGAGLESTFKIIRVIVLGIEGIVTGVIPMMFSSIGQLFTAINDSFINLLSTVVDVASYVMPDAWGDGLKSMVGGLRNFQAESDKWFKNIESDAVDSLARISDTMAEIYAYKPPEASGETPEAVLLAGAERRRKEAEAAEKARKAAEEAAKAAKTRAKELADADKQARLESNEAAEKAYREALARADGIAKAYKDVADEIDNMEKSLFKTSKQLEIQVKLGDIKQKLTDAGATLDPKYLPSLKERLELLQEQKQISDELNKIYDTTKGEAESLAAQQAALNMAFANGLVGAEAYALKVLDLEAKTRTLKMTMGDATFADAFNNALYSMVSTYEGVLPTMQTAFGDFFTNLEDGFANSVGRAIVYSEDLGDALESVAKNAIADFISALVKMGIQTALTSAMQTEASTAALATQTSASVAAASVTSGAWAPAAALTSLASFGANAVPASAGLLSTTALAEGLAQVPGFEVGGYTGNGGVSDVAGVVHGREYVFDAAATQRIGVNNLEAIRNGTASPAQASGGSGNTYVYNYTDQIPGGSQAERESRYTQFKRAMSSANTDRTSKRAQVAL